MNDLATLALGFGLGAAAWTALVLLRMVAFVLWNVVAGYRDHNAARR